jgi:fatty-acid peroxygenase
VRLPPIPSTASLDSSLALLADPYRYISRTCEQLGSDIFEARLLLQRTICLRGESAVRLFYESGHFTRKGAVPSPVKKVLFGVGGVQALDGEPHRRRKALLMSIMSPERVSELKQLVDEKLEVYTLRWAGAPKVVLYHEFRRLLTEAVCQWAGVGLAANEIDTRAVVLAGMYEEAASIGWGQIRGRTARKRCEAWVGSQLADIRVGRREVCPRSAAHVMATGEEADGRLIDLQGATVDLLSVLRPTVAVSVFMTFAAHALSKFPHTREALVGGRDKALHSFAQEVRRYYPFFPMAAARVSEPFEWQGYRFPKGRKVLLDLYGTNHHPALWDNPQEFRPERFDNWIENRNTLVPQGGGRQETNHRCVGEALTIELIKLAADLLVNRIEYKVPPQDLELDMQRLPALPPSRMEIVGVRRRSDLPDEQEASLAVS